MYPDVPRFGNRPPPRRDAQGRQQRGKWDQFYPDARGGGGRGGVRGVPAIKIE